MTEPNVRLALLWHMHQPYYLDPDTGESVLPWVRLHSLKDYWGMAALFDECPGMRATVNLVPSLIEQVEAYALERTWDRQLVLGLTEAAALNPADAAWFVQEGFHAHAPTMIDLYPRYAALWRMRASGQTFDTAALRDLQVWQKLAWVDPDLLRVDARVRRLVGKGHGFDEDDKRALRAVELDVLRRVVPAYRAAAARGQVELSTSPYFHPILPLLCDSAAHLEAHPGAALPDPPFRWPGDADLQLARAVAAHERWFGSRPHGVWPSEGSVREAAAAAIARAGFSWTASDEHILVRSRALSHQPTGAAERFHPHAVVTPDGEVRMLFRDHGLSDLIGFTYQSWPSDAAVHDFMARLRDIHAHLAGGGQTVTVPVILDGENAWEHYAGGGRPFLRALYQALAAAPDIDPVPMHEATAGAATPLARVFAGSWINADFGIWIGHADDRRAWSQLRALRERFEILAPQLSQDQRNDALDAMLAAEGSDWFWWYGDDHSSAHDREFDALFRHHLRRGYRALGEEAPDELHRTNISTVVPGDDLAAPGFVTIPGDGAISRAGGRFFARLGAVPLERPAGAMHRATARVVVGCEVGVSKDGLALWIDTAATDHIFVLEATGDADGDSVPGVRSSTVAPGGVVVPWPDLGAGPGSRLGVRLVVRDPSGRIVETVPADGVERRLALPD
ncbi:MAG: glycoside hydrolase family 57 protein, partial [Acidobacteriota bacterium]